MITPFFPGTPQTPTTKNVDIIVIPGFGTPHPDQWISNSHRWLHRLVENQQSLVQLWTFDYDFTSDEPRVAQIETKGRDLAEDLKKFRAPGDFKKPLVFICHSLGGLILKKTFGVLREQKLDYLDVIKTIAGVCFISTPHLSPESPGPEESILELMLPPRRKGTALLHSVRQDENAEIQQICQWFADFAYRTPIITVYETVTTKVVSRRSLYPKSHRIFIVPRKISGIGIDPEQNSIQPIGIDKPHNQTCCLESTDEAFVKIRDFLTQLIEKAPHTVEMAFRSNAAAQTRAGTLRSHSLYSPVRPPEDLRQEIGSPPSRFTAQPGTTERSYVQVSLPQPALLSKPTTDISSDAVDPVLRNPKLPCFSVPWERNPVFYGRAEILKLIDSKLLLEGTVSHESNEITLDATWSYPSPWVATDVVDNARSHIRSFSLCGMAGVGKTSIAIQYAYLSKQSYEAILWVKADEKDRIPEEFARIGQDLGLVESASRCDLYEAFLSVKSWLSRPVRSHSSSDDDEICDDVSWLLIFDNVNDFETLIEYWPLEGNGSVLVTSRDPLAKNQVFTVKNGLDLTPFSTTESIEFIQKLTRKTVEASQLTALNQVAERLGGHPLLVEIMTGTMHRLRLSYSLFLDYYDESGLENAGRDLQKTKGNHYDIFSKLGFTKLSDAALTILKILAFLDPDQIQEPLLHDGLDEISRAGPITFTKATYYMARAELLQSSLILQNDGQQCIHLHRVVQEISLQRMSRKEEIRCFEVAISLVSKVWPFQSLQHRFNTSRYEKCGNLFSHVFALRNGYERLKQTAPTLLRPSITAGALFNDAGWYYFERGFPQESKPFCKVAQEIFESSDDRHTDEVSYMLRESINNQGSAAAETNCHADSLYYHRKWLEMALKRRDEQGEELVDYELSVIYNEVGVAYAMNERYLEAVESFERSIKICQSLPNYEDIMLSWPLPNLGLIIWSRGDQIKAEKGMESARGLLEKAKGVLEDARQIFADKYGFDDVVTFKTGKTLYALGNVYSSLEQYDSGLNYHQRCLAQYHKSLGQKNHRVASTCHRLADHHLRRKEFGLARKFIDDACGFFQSRPYYKQEYARSTYKSGQLFTAEGHLEDADREFEKAFRLWEEINPHDNRLKAELSEMDYNQMVMFWSR